MTVHNLDEMERMPDGQYRGRCQCGHVEQPGPKDTAWEEIADHVVQHNPELKALADQAAWRRLLEDPEAAAALRKVAGVEGAGGGRTD